ncbi:methyltransferase domain-containing protein [Spongiimicrobium sp. 3-5]|uniref:methyltransferase domain-containing protein n=1 Tax=Spongiimicrobium sp. 3-5 TaxID=3332596 RepID=UPI00397F381F
MSNIVKKISAFFKKKKNPKVPFETSTQYWEERYEKGGHSGAGSYNRLAEFKAEVINPFVSTNKIDTVVEFGCGDGNQLQLFKFNSYTAYDVSDSIIQKCKDLFGDDPTKSFFHLSAYRPQTFDLSLSLDVIYHLVEDTVFEDYMERLFDSSYKYVIVYSSNDNNSESAVHVKHRKFTDWVAKNRLNFQLIDKIPNRYPFDAKNPKTTSFADFFIYEKNA